MDPTWMTQPAPTAEGTCTGSFCIPGPNGGATCAANGNACLGIEFLPAYFGLSDINDLYVTRESIFGGTYVVLNASVENYQNSEGRNVVSGGVPNVPCTRCDAPDDPPGCDCFGGSTTICEFTNSLSDCTSESQCSCTICVCSPTAPGPSLPPSPEAAAASMEVTALSMHYRETTGSNGYRLGHAAGSATRAPLSPPMPPPQVDGCTSSAWRNYNPAATVDDGSCLIEGCTDSLLDGYDAAATFDDGSCSYVFWGCMDSAAVNHRLSASRDRGCKYKGCMDSAAPNFDPSASTPGRCDAVFPGCTDSTSPSFHRAHNVDDGSCSIAGCTSTSSANYDPAATFDDLCSCAGMCGSQRSPPGQPVRTGCLDPRATSFDSAAEAHDGAMCTYTVVGCTDSAASNHVPAATVGSACEYPVVGCMDREALDYDASATVPADEPCTYAVLGCTDSLALNYAFDANVDVETVLALVRSEFGTLEDMLQLLSDASGPVDVAVIQGFEAQLWETTCVHPPQLPPPPPSHLLPGTSIVTQNATVVKLRLVLYVSIESYTQKEDVLQKEVCNFTRCSSPYCDCQLTLAAASVVADVRLNVTSEDKRAAVLEAVAMLEALTDAELAAQFVLPLASVESTVVASSVPDGVTPGVALPPPAPHPSSPMPSPPQPSPSLGLADPVLVFVSGAALASLCCLGCWLGCAKDFSGFRGRARPAPVETVQQKLPESLGGAKDFFSGFGRRARPAPVETVQQKLPESLGGA